MDLTKAVSYRGLLLNSVTLQQLASGGVLYGIELRNVEWPGVEGVGYDEKRALADGYDASDVFGSKRRVGLVGAVFGRTRGEAWDLLQAVVEAFTPAAAYDASPTDRGYLPLDFYVPTADPEFMPDGFIHKMIRVRARTQPSMTFSSDVTGGLDNEPISIPWQVIVEARDPRVYYFTPTETAISPTAASGAGNFVNKGNYPTPLSILLNIAAASPAGSFHFVGAGTDLTITIPTDPLAQIIRYSSAHKVLSREVAGVEVLRMDLLSFAANQTHPLVPVGTSAYSWTLVTADLAAGSKFWHYDAWA